jgi:hypothetical protein
MHADDARMIRTFAIHRARKNHAAARTGIDEWSYERNAWLAVAALAGADVHDLAVALGVKAEVIQSAVQGVRDTPEIIEWAASGEAASS